MSTNMAKPGHNIISWAASLLVVTWAALWLTFTLLYRFSDDATSDDNLPVLSFSAPMIVLAILSVLTPRVGGLLLVPSGVFAAWFFASTSAQAVLAAPAIVLGLALVWAGPWRRRLRGNRPRTNRRNPPRRSSSRAHRH